MIVGPAAPAVPGSLSEMQPLHENLHFSKILGEFPRNESEEGPCPLDPRPVLDKWGSPVFVNCQRAKRRFYL